MIKSHTKKLLIDIRAKALGNIFQSLSNTEHQLEAANHQLEAANILLEQIKHTQKSSLLTLTNQVNDLSTQITNSGVIKTGNHEILVKLFNGLKIYLDTRDIAVVPHLALDKIWEPQITKAWLKMVKPNDTVFDIGANFGYFGLLAGFKTNKKTSKVVLIEANTNLIPYISKTISLNWYNEQSIIENFAVSNINGEVTLNILKDYIGSSSIQSVEKLDSYMHNKMDIKLNESLKVQGITLDKYCQEHDIKSIDLLKMDIEGYEDKAYMGMRQIVRTSPNLTMFIEFTKDGYANPKKFYNQLIEDFGNVYIIDNDGNIIKPKNRGYDFIIGEADDWVMPIFSKNKSLDKIYF